MRLLQHLFPPRVSAIFPEASLQRITDVISSHEKEHYGEICFAVEQALPINDLLKKMDPRVRANEVFSELRVWDTEANSGVLIYLLLADHRIEIIADRGLAKVTTQQFWDDICKQMQEHMREKRYEEAVIGCIERVSAQLSAYFPRVDGQDDIDELPNRPHVL